MAGAWGVATKKIGSTILESNKSINGPMDSISTIAGALVSGFKEGAAQRVRNSPNLVSKAGFDSKNMGIWDSAKSYMYDAKDGEFSKLRAVGGLSGAYIAGNWLFVFFG